MDDDLLNSDEIESDGNLQERDSKDNSCIDQNSIMDDGGSNATHWSKCSIEKFTDYYNEVLKNDGEFCMDAPGACVN